jgi:predicted DNA binding CopG/RHH family protein
MKKVINGKLYNTDTAKELGAYYHGEYSDFSHYSETLYRKKTGEYFLYGEGGPMSRYAETVGQNEWSGGEKIMPMGYAEAQKWAEKHLDGDEYQAIFGEIVEDATKQMVTISVSASKWEAAKREAAKQGINISEYIERLIVESVV